MDNLDNDLELSQHTLSSTSSAGPTTSGTPGYNGDPRLRRESLPAPNKAPVSSPDSVESLGSENNPGLSSSTSAKETAETKPLKPNNMGRRGLSVQIIDAGTAIQGKFDDSSNNLDVQVNKIGKVTLLFF